MQMRTDICCLNAGGVGWSSRGSTSFTLAYAPLLAKKEGPQSRQKKQKYREAVDKKVFGVGEMGANFRFRTSSLGEVCTDTDNKQRSSPIGRARFDPPAARHPLHEPTNMSARF